MRCFGNTQWPRAMGKEDIVWNPRVCQIHQFSMIGLDMPPPHPQTNKFEKASDKLQSGDALHQMITAAKEREKNEETAK